jgi:alanine racemase
MDYNRVWAEIDLDCILHNLENMYNNIDKKADILAVIKTDAYGHGAVPIARMLEKVPYVAGYACATVDEAMELRENGIMKQILILGYVFPDEYPVMIRNGIRPTIFRYDMAKAFSDAAVSAGIDAPVHIAIDTGMSRIGFQADDKALDEIIKINALPGIILEGIFTHFARADESDKTSARAQEDLFRTVIDKLNEKGVSFKYHHCANSAAILELPGTSMELVRAGITMYGLWPSDEVDHAFPLESAMALKSHIVHLKTLPAGRAVSYGGTYVTDRYTTVATVPVGYGDGYARTLSNKSSVIIRGKKAPVIGRICMDQMMVDVSDIPDVSMYDTVTLIGRDGGESITLEELGDLSGRFNYEFACCLGNRIPRIYIKDGKVIERKHYYE